MTIKITKYLSGSKRNLKRRGLNEDVIDYISHHISIRDEKIYQLVLAFERGKKVCCPKDKFYIEEQVTDSAVSKLTINPVSGRVTIKYSRGTSDLVRNELKEFVKNKIMVDEFEPITLRGSFHFKNGHYYITLQNNGKQINKYYISE